MARYPFSRKHIVPLALVVIALSGFGAVAQLSKDDPSELTVAATTANAMDIDVEQVNMLGTSAQTIRGVVDSFSAGDVPCWAGRYACEVYDFNLAQSGAIEVTLTWEGQPRALMVQLFWAGEGLAHEDVAPRTGPSRISFRRPLMEAAGYRLRVVSLEPDQTIPFSLTIDY
jgi:hypothetical protein